MLLIVLAGLIVVWVVVVAAVVALCVGAADGDRQLGNAGAGRTLLRLVVR
jgi:hypothetical protein